MAYAEHVYAHELKDITPGRPFLMVNYKGAYIRVECSEIPKKDGYQLLVELATGRAFYMCDEKPCFLYPGESVNQ